MKTTGRQASNVLNLENWGMTPYPEALSRLHALVDRRIEGRIPDTLVLVGHPPTITLGRRSGANDLVLPEAILKTKGVSVCRTDRGGLATFHGPGQFIAYPVIQLQNRDVKSFVQTLLRAAANTLRHFGLNPEFNIDQPGLWLNGCKIASVGISVRQWVTSHGIAVNIDPDLEPFEWIIPCGMPGRKMTSMTRERKASVALEDFQSVFAEHFRECFGYADARNNGQNRLKRPEWLKSAPAHVPDMDRMLSLIDRLNLNTVCASALCPNQSECFRRGTATFMILGNRCTRACRFCAVIKGDPETPDAGEPARIVQAVKELALKHAVVTSVTRDDLPDGGASHFARTIQALHADCPGIRVEVLVPDFNGSDDALRTVIEAGPDIFNHNVETAPALYSVVRPEADYRRSIEVLRKAASEGLNVKSGMMLGMGENKKEIRQVLADLFNAGCRCVTLGQYLAPSPRHLPVALYVEPAEFEFWKQEAIGMGFTGVASGPLVRSSYWAERMLSV